MLGWKKNVKLLPPTEKGISMDSENWLSLDSIQSIALTYANQQVKEGSTISRIDVRPQKGIAKVVFANHFAEVQIDCQSGKILSTKKRYSDLIESIHDGSIIDKLFGLNHQPFKLLYTSILSISLILLCISGFFMWVNPKRMRKLKKQDDYDHV